LESSEDAQLNSEVSDYGYKQVNAVNLHGVEKIRPALTALKRLQNTHTNSKQWLRHWYMCTQAGNDIVK